MLLFRFEYKTSVIYHNVDTQNAKIARRDRPHILASHRCETFENLLHIDVSSEENSFRDLTLKKLNDDFYQYKYICFLRQQRARELGQTTGTGNEKRRHFEKV